MADMRFMDMRLVGVSFVLAMAALLGGRDVDPGDHDNDRKRSGCAMRQN
jgi:hypothetical protein